MEIIGRANEHEYLAKISRRELNDLLDKNYQEWFETGTIVNISKIYKVVDSIRKNKDELKRQADQLRAIALLLEPMQDIINLTLKGKENNE